MAYEIDSDTNCIQCGWYCHLKIGKGIGGLINKRMNGDYLNYSIIKIGQNTKKNPGDLRRLAVTQTPVEDHQLMLL